jgi:hypothetical protein
LVKSLVWGWAISLAALSIGFVLNEPSETAIFVPPALMAVVMGALIVTRVRGNLVGVTMLIGGSAWLLYAVGQDYAVLSLESESLPGEYLAAWLGAWAGPLFYLSFPTLLLLFPDGGLTTRFRRWFMLVIAALVLLTIAGAVSLWGVDFSVLIDQDGLSAEPRYGLTDFAFVLCLWLTLPATYAIVSRYRTGDNVVRQQMKWLLLGGLALAGSLVSAPLLNQSDLWGVGIAIGMSLFPIGVGVAVFKYRLYELGRIVSRTVSYAFVVAVLGAVFAFGVVLIPNELMEGRDRPTLLVAASTLAAAALFNPLRKGAQGWIDRRFNRSQYDTGLVMDRFAGSLRERVDPEDVVEGWVGVVEDTMRPSAVGIWVRS